MSLGMVFLKDTCSPAANHGFQSAHARCPIYARWQENIEILFFLSSSSVTLAYSLLRLQQAI